MKTITYNITGMHCGSCAMHIESALNEIPGIEKVYVDFSRKTASITFSNNLIPQSTLQETISKIGEYTLKEDPEETPNKEVKKGSSPLQWGILGTLGISILFYLVQVLGMQSFSGPLEFVRVKWYFVLPLVIGFGIQMGLFRAIYIKTHITDKTVVASGGVSTTAMIACCMHNFVPLLPLLGLSGIAVFFSTYQDYVFGISLLFVLGGIVLMLKKYKKVAHACAVIP